MVPKPVASWLSTSSRQTGTGGISSVSGPTTYPPLPDTSYDTETCGPETFLSSNRFQPSQQIIAIVEADHNDPPRLSYLILHSILLFQNQSCNFSTFIFIHGNYSEFPQGGDYGFFFIFTVILSGSLLLLVMASVS